MGSKTMITNTVIPAITLHNTAARAWHVDVLMSGAEKSQVTGENLFNNTSKQHPFSTMQCEIAQALFVYCW